MLALTLKVHRHDGLRLLLLRSNNSLLANQCFHWHKASTAASGVLEWCPTWNQKYTRNSKGKARVVCIHVHCRGNKRAEYLGSCVHMCTMFNQQANKIYNHLFTRASNVKGCPRVLFCCELSRMPKWTNEPPGINVGFVTKEELSALQRHCFISTQKVQGSLTALQRLSKQG